MLATLCTWAQTDRTVIKRVCDYVTRWCVGDQFSVKVRRLKVAGPAPFPETCPLVKGWGAGLFLLLHQQRCPSHIQRPIMVTAGKKRENEGIVPRAIHFWGHCLLGPQALADAITTKIDNPACTASTPAICTSLIFMCRCADAQHTSRMSIPIISYLRRNVRANTARSPRRRYLCVVSKAVRRIMSMGEQVSTRVSSRLGECRPGGTGGASPSTIRSASLPTASTERVPRAAATDEPIGSWGGGGWLVSPA